MIDDAEATYDVTAARSPPAEAAGSILSCTDLRKVYRMGEVDVRALDGVDFTLLLAGDLPTILTRYELGDIADEDPEWRATARYSREELEIRGRRGPSTDVYRDLPDAERPTGVVRLMLRSRCGCASAIHASVASAREHR